jgi:hypothetical protein
MEVSRDSYYGLRKRYFCLGRPGLRPTSRRGPRLRPEIEADVLEITRTHPEWSKHEIAGRLGSMSATGVLGVWRRRHIPTTREARVPAVVAARPKGWKPPL